MISLVVSAGTVSSIFSINSSLVWVSKDFSGPIRCENNGLNEEQEILQSFSERNITFFFRKKKYKVIDTTCGHPAYEFTQYLLIHNRNLENVKQLGYKYEGGAIYSAAERGNFLIAKLLLAIDPRLAKSKNSFGHTPLHYAAYFGHKELVEILISKGAVINAPTENGLTPLHQAAYFGHKDVVEFLISKGADVNATSINGATPLHYATIYDQKAVIALLTP